MKRTSRLSIVQRDDDRELRERMARVRVLIADRDSRTAALVQRIIFSLGIRGIEMTTDGEEALELLKARPYDFLITEWNMHPFDGITLVKTIRAAREDQRIRRDIPIIMLTARAELDSVQEARDAGISEFVAKPFSAKSISNRIVQIIDNPRAFVDSLDYAGPCRRRRGLPPPGIADRRVPQAQEAHVSPPDYSLLEKLGVDSAQEVITDAEIAQAEQVIATAQSELVAWARDDIRLLTESFNALLEAPESIALQLRLKESATTIHARSEDFGYALGVEVSTLLVHYIASRPFPKANHLRVISKHIDTLRAVFNQKIQEGNHEIGRQLIASLKQLISKLE